MQPKASNFWRYITYDDLMKGTPPPWLQQNIANLDLSKAVSRTWKRCKIGGKLVLMTNRKSQMSFLSVQKSVTLNDLERRNGPYFSLFQRIRQFKRHVQKLFVNELTASSQFCSRFINSRFTAHYLSSYRLIW